jgi:hypothetical protein
MPVKAGMEYGVGACFEVPETATVCAKNREWGCICSYFFMG